MAASWAFDTPVRRQNNTLILGAGGFRFGGYPRRGMPLEALVLAVPVLLLAVPLWRGVPAQGADGAAGRARPGSRP